MIVSAVLIVRDEADVIEACLESIRHVADEIIVMDTGSVDDTKAIASRFTSHVHAMPWPGDFAKARNEAVALASGDWVLQVDADERILDPSSGRAKLDAFTNSHDANTIGTVVMESTFQRAGHRQMTRTPLARLFARDYAHYEGAIHEQLVLNSSTPVYAPTGLTMHHLGYDRPEQISRQKTDRNRALLRQAIENDPENPYYRYQLGKTLFASGQFAVAAIQLRDALTKMRRDPSVPEDTAVDCLVTTAYALASTGRHHDALQFLQSPPETAAHWADYHHALGYLHLQLGDIASSKAAYEQALAIGSDREIVQDAGGAAAHYHLGLLAEADHDLESAAAHYADALRLRPDHGPTLSRIADWPVEHGVSVAPAIIEPADQAALVEAFASTALDCIKTGESEKAKAILASAKNFPAEIYEAIAKRLTGD